MKKQWKRLLMAALISTSVFALTFYWYQGSAQKIIRNSNEKPLAYVGTVVDDIQRRPATRLLWQIVNTGEPLYNGEAIRTSSLGEVRIQFADSDRYLDLEPDSLIVIKKSEGAIALDLMEGSLFVNAANSSTQESTGLVLNSSSGKVDLSKASASLSKTQGKDVEVQVLKGDASLKTSDGQSKALQTTSQIKIISPSLQKPSYVNGEDIQPIVFQWQGLPPQAEVQLWVGANRKQLVQKVTATPGQDHLSANMKLGKHFWRLVAKQNNQVVAETPIYRTEVSPRFPPTVTNPTVDAVVPAYSANNDVNFTWQRGDDSQVVQLVIAKDPQFQQVITNKSFATENGYAAKNLPPGNYYWKISSVFSDSSAPIAGKVQKFTLTPAEQMRSELARSLRIKFLQSEAEQTQQFIDKPQLQVQWASEKMEGVDHWQLLVRPEGDTTSAPLSFKVKDQKYTASVPKPGRYIASIEAVNKEGFVLGSSTSNPILVEMKPLPAIPQFIPETGPLQATADGRVQLKWTSVPEAAQYRLQVLKNGQELKTANYPTASTSLKNLLPGQYQLELIAIDKYGRLSEKSESRTLLVPDLSNLKAPSLKRIKVD